MYRFLRFVNEQSCRRSAWLLLLFGTLALELTSLFFQYVMMLPPCVYCIYQRTAVLGILLASLIGVANPSAWFIRFLAIAIWVYSAVKGLAFAIIHTKLQLFPSPFQTCDAFVNFPSWIPVNQWFPSFFEAYGNCSVKLWSFLTLEMPVWMVIIFSIYLIIAAVVILSQFFKTRYIFK